MSNDSSIRGLSRDRGRARVAGVSIATRVLQTLGAWRRRVAERRELSLLDDCLLRDIGLTRSDVDYEVRKLFWRP